MCIARVLLLCSIPLFVSKSPFYQSSNKQTTMEGSNNTSSGEGSHFDYLYDLLLPGDRILVSVVLFLFAVMLILICLSLLVSLVRDISPKSKPVHPEKVADEPQKEVMPESTRQEQTQIRFRGPGQPPAPDMTPMNHFAPQYPAYPQVQTNQADLNPPVCASAPSAPPLTATNHVSPQYPGFSCLNTPVQTAIPSAMTSTPAGHFVPPYPVESPALSPLNPFRSDVFPPRAEPSIEAQREVTPNPTRRTDDTSCIAPDLSSFSRRKERVPEVFTGTKSELKDWQCQFEIVAKYNGWNYAEKGSNAACSLRGNAQQVLYDMPADEREDYEAILKALKRRFDPENQESLKKIEFKSRSKKREETMNEYTFALRRLVHSAFPKLPSDAQEDMLVDQFIRGLPNEACKRHVHNNHPKTLDKAAFLASDFDSFESRYNTRKPEDRSVRVVNKENREEESSTMKCMKDLIQVMTTFVKNQVPQSTQNSRSTGCHNCGDLSHFARECPHPKEWQKKKGPYNNNQNSRPRQGPPYNPPQPQQFQRQGPSYNPPQPRQPQIQVPYYPPPQHPQPPNNPGVGLQSSASSLPAPPSLVQGN